MALDLRCSSEESIESATQRLALSRALSSIRQNVLFICMSWMVVLAVSWHYGNHLALISISAVGMLNAAWRMSIALSTKAVLTWSDAFAARVVRLMEINGVIGALAWSALTLVIVPKFGLESQFAYYLLTLASLNTTSKVLPLFGKAFLYASLLVLTTTLIEAALHFEEKSALLLGLSLVFGAFLTRGAYAFRDAALASTKNEIEARKADAALRIAKDTAEQADKAKSLFLATMSHELRTPLFGIGASADMLLKRPRPGLEREVIQTIDQSAKHLLDLLNQILQVTQIGSTNLPVEIKTINASKVVQDTVESFLILAHNKGVQLNCSIDASEPIMIRCDEHRLKQVIFNLVSNALKFTVAGSVDVDVHLKEDAVVIDIADTGPGIAASSLPHIFEPFNQGASNTTWERQRGLGLGLSITRGICNALGGDVSCRSQLGVGSIFSVKLPQRRKAEGVRDSTFSTAPGKLSAFEGSIWPGVSVSALPLLTASDNLAAAAVETSSDSVLERTQSQEVIDVLVIDDAEINRQVEERILVNEGHRVTKAATPVDGLLLLACRAYKVVLLDLEMPGMSGLQLIEEYRKISPERLQPAWIMVTGHDTHQARLAATAVGASAFVVKPINSDALVQAFNAAARLTKSLANRPILDAGKLLEHTEKGTTFLRQLIDVYKIDAPAQVHLVNAGIANADARAVQAALHTLQGLSSELGDAETAHSCRTLSHRLKPFAVAEDGSPSSNEPVEHIQSTASLMAMASAPLVRRLEANVAVGIDSLCFYVRVKDLKNKGISR